MLVQIARDGDVSPCVEAWLLPQLQHKPSTLNPNFPEPPSQKDSPQTPPHLPLKGCTRYWDLQGSGFRV